MIAPESSRIPDLMPKHPAESLGIDEIASLTRRAEAGVLTRADVGTVLQEHVPFFVLADDDPQMRKMVLDIVARGRERAGTLLRLEGDMTRCFDALPGAPKGQLPVVICFNGTEAEQAARIISERKIGNGVLVFDQFMADGPTGLETFVNFRNRLPATTTRALFSGTMPSNIDDYLRNGVLDLAFCKPRDVGIAPAAIAETFLKKTARGPKS